MSEYASRRRRRTKHYRQFYRARLNESLPHAINPDDVGELLSAIDKKRDKALIMLLLRTGMRIGELLDTKVKDIVLKDQKILIYRSSKNHRGRVTYFSDDAKTALRAWMRTREPKSEYLFYGHGGRPLSYAAARVHFKKCINKARLGDKGYTLHCLRHTFASEALSAGMPLESVQKLLGHCRLEVTRRYAKLTDKSLEEEYFTAMSVIQRGGINGCYRID